VLRWLLLLSALGALQAAQAPRGAETGVLRHDPLLRPGLALRLDLQVSNPDGARQVVIADLRQGDRVIARQGLSLDSAVQLDRGISLFLMIPSDLSPEPATLQVHIEGGSDRPLEFIRNIPSWTGAREQLATISRQLAATAGSDEQMLWVEQAQLAAQGTPDLADLAMVSSRLALLSEHAQRAPLEPKASVEWALRCPIDASVQPVRIHMPAGTPVALVHVLRGLPRTPSKDRWDELPRSWRDAAAAAQLTLVEWYPAGDRHWHGIAQRRFSVLAPQIMRSPALRGLPQVLLGANSGAQAALNLAGRYPERFAAVGLVTPSTWFDPTEARLRPELATWLQASDSPRAAAASLHPSPVTLIAAQDGVWDLLAQRHLDSWRRMPNAEAMWPWLAAQATIARPPRQHAQFQITQPGRYGPVLVHRLSTWGQAAHLRLDAGQLSGDGLAVLEWADSSPRPQLAIPEASWGRTTRRGAAKQDGQTCGPLAGYAQSSFAVVIGSAGSVAARESARSLAQAFLDDWVAHAQGAPPWCFSNDTKREAITGAAQHLVLVGNAESNPLIADLIERGALGLQWNQRSIGHNGRSFRPGPKLAVAVCRPHPDDATRLVVILSGAASWQRGGASLPLAGLGDYALIPQPGYSSLDGTHEPLFGLFDTHWR
jgi:hypothetical protein